MGKHQRRRLPSHHQREGTPNDASPNPEPRPQPEPPDGGWGWVVAVGAFIEMFLTMGTLLCCGVYFTPLQLEFGKTSAQLGWLISSGSTLLSATCPIGSACVKKFGCRPTALVGGVAVSCGFIGSSFGQTSTHIFISLGLVAGIGSGLVFVSSAVILGHYFKSRYAIVNGLVFSGPGFAIFTYPPLLDYFVETYGWRGSFLIQGAISMHTIAAAALFRCPNSARKKTAKRPTDSSYVRVNADDDMHVVSAADIDQNRNSKRLDHYGEVVSGLESEISVISNSGAPPTTLTSTPCLSGVCDILPNSDAKVPDVWLPRTDFWRDQTPNENGQMLRPEAILESTAESRNRGRFSFSRLRPRKNRCWPLYFAAFILVCPVSFFQACAFYSVTSHLVARTSFTGVSPRLAGMALSALGAGSTFTRLTHGWFVHRGIVSATTAYIVALCVGAAGAFGNAVARTYVGVIMASLFIGLSSGSVYPLVPVVLRDLVSLRGLPTTYGLAMFFDSCGVFAGGITAGLLRDVTGDYTASFSLTGAFYGLAACSLILVPLLQKRNRQQDLSVPSTT